MNQYVVCYAAPDVSWDSVLLIQKNRPEWQAGRYNLPGGHIEEDETIHAAAVRELKEETNIDCPQDHVRIMGTIEGTEFIVYVCRCDYLCKDNPAETMTDERVFWMPFSEALNHEKLIDNLRLVISFCNTGLVGWHIVSEKDGIFIITDKKEHA
jgi:8-oxo-dGTP diphosphatase